MDQNKSEKKINIENFNFVISNLSGYFSDFSMNINELNFKNNFGVQINDFKSKFEFKDGRLVLDDTNWILLTRNKRFVCFGFLKNLQK